jgi:hypothetical protein
MLEGFEHEPCLLPDGPWLQVAVQGFAESSDDREGVGPAGFESAFAAFGSFGVTGPHAA